MNSSNNLKSGQKALFMKVLILAIVIVAVAVIGLLVQKSSLSSIFNSGFKDYQRSSKLLKDVNLVHANLYRIKGMVAAGQDKQEIAKISDQQIAIIDGCVKQAKNAVESNISSEQKEFYKAILGNLTEYQKSAVQVIKLAPMNAGSAFLYSANEKMDATVQVLSQLLVYENNKAEQAYSSGNTFFYIFVIVLVVLLILCFVIIPSFIKKMVTSSIIEPVQETAGVLKEFAAGKYNRSLVWEADDAIRELVEAVNTLRSKLSTAPAQKTAGTESAQPQSDAAKDAAPDQKATAVPQAAPAQSEEKAKSLSDMLKKSPEQTKEADKLVISSRKAIDKLQDI